MGNIIKCSKLDFLTIKNYVVKNILLMLAVCIFVSVVNKNTVMVIGMVGIYGMLLLSYTFVFEERNHLDNFYGTLAIKRKTIVGGRYVFTILLGLLCNIVSCAAALILNKVMGFSMLPDETLSAAAGVFIVYLLIVSVQMPIYFKLGYTKARMIAIIPIFVICFGVPAAVSSLGFDVESFAQKLIMSIDEHTAIYGVLGVSIMLLILFISYLLSAKFYEGRRE